MVDPRACGVDDEETNGEILEEGGSPRMRGRHVFLVKKWFDKGWIPAHAG